MKKGASDKWKRCIWVIKLNVQMSKGALNRCIYSPVKPSNWAVDDEIKWKCQFVLWYNETVRRENWKVAFDTKLGEGQWKLGRGGVDALDAHENRQLSYIGTQALFKKFHYSCVADGLCRWPSWSSCYTHTHIHTDTETQKKRGRK